MPNRSKNDMPAVYANTSSDWDISGSDKGCALPLDFFDVTFVHFHNTLELGLCVSGEGVCYVDGMQYPFRAHDTQIIFPFQKHISKSTGREPSMWYWLNIDPLKLFLANGFDDVDQVDLWLHDEMSLCGIISREQYPEISRLVEKIISANYELSSHVHKNSYLSANLYLLILEMCEASKDIPHLKLAENPDFARLLPAINRIKDDLEAGSKSKVAHLADICCMSVANFRKVFTGAVGVSPKQYIQLSGIRKARQLLLTTNLSILEIGLSTGYSDISGFNKSFYSHTAMSPSQFRAKYAKLRQ